LTNLFTLSDPNFLLLLCGLVALIGYGAAVLIAANFEEEE